MNQPDGNRDPDREPGPDELADLEQDIADGVVPIPFHLRLLFAAGTARGYVTRQEVLQVCDEEETPPDAVYAELFEAGIDIREEPPERPDAETADSGVKPEKPGHKDDLQLYLNEIRRIPLLSAREEIELARRVADGLLAGDALDAPEAMRTFRKSRRPAGGGISEATPGYTTERGPGAAADSLKQALRSGEEARRRLTEGNLRLVVSIAKRYVGRGMYLLDLIQEGNLGLLRAVEKFDYARGFRFSTYAIWWIRHAIGRALADQARTIRIPIHRVQTLGRMARATWRLQQTLGRTPTLQELADDIGLNQEILMDIQETSKEPISLEAPLDPSQDRRMRDLIEDRTTPEPDLEMSRIRRKESLWQAMEFLRPMERKVISLRFGLEDGRNRTLEEIGRAYGVTRERIRQIEGKALRKLRHPDRNKKLRDYL